MAGSVVNATTRREAVAVLVATVTLALAWKAVGAARRAADPRGAIVREIRREGSSRDLLIITDEAPELVAEAAPMPALWGAVPLDDLTGVRRVYALAPNEPGLTPFFARFGTGRSVGVFAQAWDLADTARVVFDASAELGTRVNAHRDGGVDGGPCTPAPGALVCHGPPWNSVRVEPHHFDGAELPCLFAHPQADGRLVLELTNLPPAQALVGVVGIDDGGFFPTGAPVTLHVEVRPTGLPPVIRDVVAPNRRGVSPFRVDVPHVPSSASLTITTPDAGARQFCLTLRATDGGSGQRKP